MKDRKKYTYDIAISFAEEKRDVALILDKEFKSGMFRKMRSYYYPENRDATVGLELGKSLDSIYEKEARYALIILSKEYLSKKYCNIELAAIIRRQKKEKRYAFILLTDETRPEDIDFPESFVYAIWDYDPDKLAQVLREIILRKFPPTWLIPSFIMSAVLVSSVWWYSTWIGAKVIPTLFNYEVANSAVSDVAILISDSLYRKGEDLTIGLLNTLQNDSVRVYNGLLNQEIVKGDVFQQLLNVNPKSINEYDPLKSLDFLMIGSIEWKQTKDHKYELEVVEASLHLSIICLADPSRSRTYVFKKSVNYSDVEKARESAIKGLINVFDYEFDYNW